MKYLFECVNCNNREHKEIPISKYDTLSKFQVCSKCGENMNRVIEWTGPATNLGGYSAVAGKASWQ